MLPTRCGRSAGSGPRSPDRPNPIGPHTVTITALQPDVIAVRNLEAIDGTPVLDIKPVR